MLAAPSRVRRVRHHPALPYREIPAFMGELRGRDSVSARALELTILTAVRTSEAIGASWGEIDLDHRVWSIPAERMKAGKEHRIPLSDRAVEILAGLPRKGDRVFPLSNMAMLELLRGMRPRADELCAGRYASRRSPIRSTKRLRAHIGAATCSPSVSG
jgi:integrase